MNSFHSDVQPRIEIKRLFNQIGGDETIRLEFFVFFDQALMCPIKSCMQRSELRSELQELARDEALKEAADR